MNNSPNSDLASVFTAVARLRQCRAAHKTKGFVLADVSPLMIAGYLTIESGETLEAVEMKGSADVLDEMGDVLGCLVNLGLRLGFTEEQIVKACHDKLATRFHVPPAPVDRDNYRSGFKAGDRVKYRGRDSFPIKYNPHTVAFIEKGLTGTVQPIPNLDPATWPYDAVQVRFDDGGTGAVDLRLLERL